MVPVPPSKTKEHGEYDDRMLKLLNRVKALAKKDFNVDGAQVFEAVKQNKDMKAAHTTNYRPRIDDLQQIYKTADPSEINLSARRLVVFDDVLTAGTHFKAMQATLAQAYGVEPVHKICGIFIARRVIPKYPAG